VRGRDLLVVGVAARKGLGEDGRVRGDADDGVAFDRTRERARLEQVAREKSIQTLWPWSASWWSGVLIAAV
jgi:hypothetical protein